MLSAGVEAARREQKQVNMRVPDTGVPKCHYSDLNRSVGICPRFPRYRQPRGMADFVYVKYIIPHINAKYILPFVPSVPSVPDDTLVSLSILTFCRKLRFISPGSALNKSAWGLTAYVYMKYLEPNIYMNYIKPNMPVMFHLLLLISLAICLLLFNIVHKAFLPRHLQTSASAGISSPL